ncbi:MAG: alpha/beta hydrolase [Myxococcota bacterium]
MTREVSENTSTTWRIIRSAVFLFLLAYVVYVALLAGLQRQIIFPGTRFPVDEQARPPGADSERIWLPIEEGRVESWYFPAPDASADNPRPLVILAHGNGEFIENWANGIGGYREMGINVLLPEYRGYGRSDGEPSQEAITQDFERFREKVASRPEVDEARIVYHGFSLGGAALASLADRKPPEAMILQSTFTRVIDMVAVPVPEALVADPFDTLAVVRDAEYPILVVHGRSDSVVPFGHGRRLHKVAQHADFVEHPGDHHQMTNRVRYWGAIRDLLERSGVVKEH